jgi:hypothetical protein
MHCDNYKHLNKDKIGLYLEHGFTQEQIDIPLMEILCSLNVIIITYKKLTYTQEWSDAADFIKKHMLELSNHSEDPGGREDLYQKVRPYIQKDIKRINDLKYRFTLPPQEKINEYSDILSELALDCIDKCVQEFKEETKKMQLIQPKLKLEEVEDKKKKEQKYKSNSKRNFLERLERIRNADEKWQEEYVSFKETACSDQNADGKKRKRIVTLDHKSPPTKKRVTWDETVTGGNTDGNRYRNRTRKSRNEIDKKCSNQIQANIEPLTAATKQTMSRA